MWELFKFNVICSHFLSFERWKVLLRYSSTAHRGESPFESLQGRRNVLAEARGFKVSSHFTVERWRQTVSSTRTPPPPARRHPSAQTIPLLSNEGWDVALLHLWMTLSLCVSYTVLGRLGMKSSDGSEWQFNQRPFSRCALSVSIKLLHLAWPAR